ncbi:MAG: hypothetical protein WCC57_01790 [Paracoccaceae bacterium]
MAKISTRVKKPTASKDDTLAYFTPAPRKAAMVREITAIEQMYGYYIAD